MAMAVVPYPLRHHLLLLLLLFFFSVSGVIPLCQGAAPASGGGGGKTSIFFNTLGRSRYAYDVFSSPVPAPLIGSSSSLSSIIDGRELRVTDGEYVNYNGFFPADPSRLLSLLHDGPPTEDDAQQQPAAPLEAIVYVSERKGTSNIYLDAYPSVGGAGGGRRVHLPLLRPDGNGGVVSMKDRPSVVGDALIYVSTHEDSGVPRLSWAAVYSTHLPTGETRRLSPPGVPDFSPAVSPSGEWTAVASWGSERAWTKENHDLNTSIYVFRTRDGSGRKKVVDHGGWPTWADESTLFFHKKSDDGWWSVFRAVLGEGRPAVERITPPGFHAFTPAAGKGFVAMATRRNTSEFRHIELLDLARNTFVELTRPISPELHHFNPFVSPDSTRIGYHRCRGGGGGGRLMFESLTSPIPDVSLFRIDASFPSISPDGSRIAFSALPGLYVMNSDGSRRRQILPDYAFPTVWDPKRKGVLYTSIGPVFGPANSEVDVVSITLPDEEEEEDGGAAEPAASARPVIKKLTTDGSNNAFPSPSPDGKWVVFRSGRSGHKNLYIMDAVEGERAGLRRLTDGPGMDTMCTWSPDGEWIAFSSNMSQPDPWRFVLYLIHPNGTGLRTLFRSGAEGRANHPAFSPDSKRVVFSADYAGVSSEPVSNADSALPYGEMFVVGIDGTGLRRLTHNAYEDGTVVWSPFYMEPGDVAADQPPCEFNDCSWLVPVGSSSSAASAARASGCPVRRSSSSSRSSS